MSLISNKNTNTSNVNDNFIPKDNSDYKKQDYWNKRFDNEDEYDWLISYSKSIELQNYFINI